MDILAEILAHKKDEVAAAKNRRPLAELKAMVADLPDAPRPFADSLLNAGVGDNTQLPVIAEIKHRSPSKGVLCENFAPAEIAAAYQRAGAACLSVLTDEKFFGGNTQHLADAADATALPILRKDFTVDEWQIWEARYIGAAAILLIVAALSAQQLTDFAALATELKLDVLVETHNAEEMATALRVPPPALIGINNRDLKTFRTDLQTTLDLLPMAAANNRAVISESGIHHRADIIRLQNAGTHAFLIGEALLNNPQQKLTQLFPRHSSPATD